MEAKTLEHFMVVFKSELAIRNRSDWPQPTKCKCIFVGLFIFFPVTFEVLIILRGG